MKEKVWRCHEYASKWVLAPFIANEHVSNLTIGHATIISLACQSSVCIIPLWLIGILLPLARTCSTMLLPAVGLENFQSRHDIRKNKKSSSIRAKMRILQSQHPLNSFLHSILMRTKASSTSSRQSAPLGLRFRCHEVDPIVTDKNWHRNSLAVSTCSDLTRQPKRPYSTPCLSAFQLHIADLGYSFFLPYYIVCICQVDAVGLHRQV
jgi:hypothetical protein